MGAQHDKLNYRSAWMAMKNISLYSVFFTGISHASQFQGSNSSAVISNKYQHQKVAVSNFCISRLC